jgi:hypothetical protein
MSLVDWILNIAAIFLWMDWRSARSAKPQSILSIAGTVRHAGRAAGKGFGSLAALILILVVRPAFYYTVGSALNWTPAINFLSISIPWRSDLLGRMYIFSTLTFLKVIGYYYAWLLLLSVVNRRLTDEDRIQRFVRGQLAWLERFPAWLKLLLPSIITALAWVPLAALFAGLELIPKGGSDKAIWIQAAAFALAALLVWKWLIIAFFVVHLLNIYVYMGTHLLWHYIGVTSRKLLLPFSFLRSGKLDLSPVAGIIVIDAIAEWWFKPLVLRVFQEHLR